ncbi:hypothetical protein B0T26DRAFT_784693 [Lasiosphaeria miniovina]|uniref:Uncharacterized protein n=1 Tax=Lasiosphaeria miniovina TaxID=1954250 RepID=A0AA40A4B3_9PEZI|nr:uncharacterized protein B0T26DRAFT_784693 [Lasiosphaeria miniovina]KAK0709043.1 hypothetical protein B0T26DRAFT_784693 [Lasiosphaeria miniovina]
MARPQGSSGTKQLATEERQRIRVLYFDASKSEAEIHSITGYTKPRSGLLYALTMPLLGAVLAGHEP